MNRNHQRQGGYDKNRSQRPFDGPKTPSVTETYQAILTGDYTSYAEQTIKNILKRDNRNVIKTSQVRNIYALISPFFEQFDYDDQINIDEAKRTLQKAKIKIAYQIGRDDKNRLGVRVFNDYTNVLGLIDVVLVSDQFLKDLKRYCDYLEAIVAYHKFHVKE